MSSEDGNTKWTVMIYLAGDNNLTDECIYALTEMRKVTSNGAVRVIAQFDPKDEHLPSQRYEIGLSRADGTLAQDMFDDTNGGSFKIKSTKDKPVMAMRPGGGAQPDDTATGDPATLFNFISMCIERSRAEHYMLVIAGHGSGTTKDYLLKDDSPDGYLTIPEFKSVLQDVKEGYTDAAGNPLVIDIVGMDVCLMSMAEICYEFRNLARVMVGCESYSPASGWPYRPILERLMDIASKESAPGEALAGQEPVQNRVASAVVEEYVNFYSDYWLGGLSVDQSALDVTKVEGLREVVEQLAGRLSAKLVEEDNSQKNRPEGEVREYPFKDALILSHWEAQSYNGELYVDLADFCTCLGRRCGDAGLSDLCANVDDFIKSNFVLKSCYSGPAFQYSYGVSIYFPWSEITPDYQNLDFATESTWAQFLQVYIDRTRRLPRAVESDLKLIDMNRAAPRRFRESSGRGPENPMHSMRNPPIVAPKSDCMRDKSTKGEEQLFL